LIKNICLETMEIEMSLSQYFLAIEVDRLAGEFQQRQVNSTAVERFGLVFIGFKAVEDQFLTELLLGKFCMSLGEF
jgi:hypothetical protein